MEATTGPQSDSEAPDPKVQVRGEVLVGEEAANLLRAAAVACGVVFANIHDRELEEKLAVVGTLLTDAIARCDRLDVQLPAAPSS